MGNGEAGTTVGRRARRALALVTDAIPGGEAREGQQEMAAAVADAIHEGRHLLVQAGTGTGKTLAYLVPAVLSGRTTVVATATKALQEQLVARDLPLLASHLERPFSFSMLKGRSNYLCRAALADAAGTAGQGVLVGDAVDAELVAAVAAWSVDTETGDRADLPIAVRDGEWAQLSVGPGECPGAHRCPHGETCFAEGARAVAAESDVIVVNTHLYGLHLATGGAVLPEHDVAVFDEAHALAAVAADTLGLSMGPRRIANLARAVRSVFTADHPAAIGLDGAAARLEAVLEGLVGARVDPADGDLGVILVGCADSAAAALGAARELDAAGDTVARKERLVQLASGVTGDLHLLGELSAGQVAWAERNGTLPLVRVAPVDVGEELPARLFSHVTAILTSATLTVGESFDPAASRLGLDRPEAASPAREGDVAPSWAGVDVGSPFDYERQALLYCAAHLPDPRAPGYEAAMLEELEELVVAAGGRTLGLFTSRRAMAVAAAHLDERLDVEVLVQDQLPRPVLQRRFLDEETSVLLATMGFWQGFDAPGSTCSLVVIDRLPFARPDDPLADARREAATRAKRNAFGAVDLPDAATLLAQGAGRLIRSAGDTGVVAVLDRRLATASYRWTLVRSLPPMRRTKDPDEARRVLRELASARAS
ncbi:MAG: ATP-dependent DNA helicase [Acidimicrobiales bacterium]